MARSLGADLGRSVWVEVLGAAARPDSPSAGTLVSGGRAPPAAGSVLPQPARLTRETSVPREASLPRFPVVFICDSSPDADSALQTGAPRSSKNETAPLETS